MIQKSLRHSIDKVLHCSSTSNIDLPASLSAHKFSSFFIDKIKSLRANLPLINVNPFSFPDQLAPKSTCLSDPIPSKLLPYCVDVIVPVVSHIINLSLNTGIFPNDLKSAFVKPFFKKNLL